MSKSKNQRAIILDAAYSVLCEKGLPSLSYTSIAEVGDVSRQLVRYYFKTPDDLMFAICERIESKYRAFLESGIPYDRGGARSNQIFDFFYGMSEDECYVEDHSVYDALMSLASGSGAIRENLRELLTHFGTCIADALQEDYPELSRSHCDELAYFFVSQCYGHWRMVGSLGLSPDHRFASRRVIDHAIASYRQAGSKISAMEDVWSVPA